MCAKAGRESFAKCAKVAPKVDLSSQKAFHGASAKVPTLHGVEPRDVGLAAAQQAIPWHRSSQNQLRIKGPATNSSAQGRGTVRAVGTSPHALVQLD